MKSKDVFPGFPYLKNTTSLSFGNLNEADNSSKCKLCKRHGITAEHATHYLHGTEKQLYDKSQQQKMCFITLLAPSQKYPKSFLSLFSSVALPNPVSSPFQFYVIQTTFNSQTEGEQDSFTELFHTAT